MLKEPSASWMRAGIHYWLGYAGPYLAAGLLRLAVVDTEDDRLNAVRATSNAWGVGMVAAFCFALTLLTLKGLRPCRPENVFGSAALGLMTAVCMIALGIEWNAYTLGADRVLIAALLSAIILHAFTPRAARTRGGIRRARQPGGTQEIVPACWRFLGTFMIISIFWFLGFTGADGAAMLMRLVALPVLIITTLVYGLIGSFLFGAGAALARHARREPVLRGWYSAVSAFCSILLLLAESAVAGQFGFYLDQVSWSMLAPLLFGLGSALLPRPRVAA